MKLRSTLFSLSLLGPALVGCDDGSYRLGGRAEADPEPLGGRGGPGGDQSADGGLGLGGRSGTGGSGAANAGGIAGITDAGGAGSAGAGSTGESGGTAGVGAATSSGGAGSGGTAGNRGTGDASDGRDIVNIAQDLGGAYNADADEQFVYFSHAAGPIWRIDHSGAGLVKLDEGPCAYLETDDTHVYWATLSNTLSAIRRVAKTGGAAETVASFQTFVTERSAAVFLAFDHAFVYGAVTTASLEPGAVFRAPKAGGEMQVVVRTENGAVGQMAVSQSTLYWANLHPPAGIRRLDLTTSVNSSLYRQGAYTLRVVGGELAFVSSGDGSGDGPLIRAPLDGGAMKPSTGISALFFDSDATHVYWIARSFEKDSLMRTNLATDIEEVVATLSTLSVRGVTATGQWLFAYAAHPTAGGIFRVEKPVP